MKPLDPSLKTRTIQSLMTGIPGDLWRHMNQADLLTVSSSLAYITILSIIPALAVSFAIFRAFGGMEHLYGTLEPFILNNLAEGTGGEVVQKFHEFIDNAHASAIGLGGLVGLIFTTMSMLSSMEKAINRVWHVPVARSLFSRIASYWLILTLGPLALAVTVGFITSKDLPLSALLPSGTGAFGLAIGVFFLIYKYVPSCAVRARYALLAAAVTALLFNLARQAYALYTEEAVAYGKIYGSLAAVPVLLFWIYIVWVIVLSGAALSAVLQRRFEAAIKLATNTPQH